ncbi:hypothetical protein ACIRVK_45095 [Streptomyces sp. NPDC101152]|uniref:hypothetical protein n=1 Tax=Streptomyces sp. NPDC101152 TaxID=3366116 RepID=UPI003824D936
MGKRVLAAFGVVAPMDGVLASGLSAAPTSADAATSSTAERTGSSEEAQLRALYPQAVAEGGRLVVFTGGDRSGRGDYLKNAFERRSRAALDRYKARLGLYIGDVHGANSPDPTSSASTRSTGRAPKAEPLLDTGCPPRPGSRRTPRREAISPTITLHPRKHA